MHLNTSNWRLKAAAGDSIALTGYSRGITGGEPASPGLKWSYFRYYEKFYNQLCYSNTGDTLRKRSSLVLCNIVSVVA